MLDSQEMWGAGNRKALIWAQCTLHARAQLPRPRKKLLNDHLYGVEHDVTGWEKTKSLSCRSYNKDQNLSRGLETVKKRKKER